LCFGKRVAYIFFFLLVSFNSFFFFFFFLSRLQNTSREALGGVRIALAYNSSQYRVEEPVVTLPLLLPSAPYSCSTLVHVC
jgi:hypothetical protein